MTSDELNAVAEALLQALAAVEDSPEAPTKRRVIVRFALQGVHMQALADMRRPDAP